MGRKDITPSTDELSYIFHPVDDNLTTLDWNIARGISFFFYKRNNIQNIVDGHNCQPSIAQIITLPQSTPAPRSVLTYFHFIPPSIVTISTTKYFRTFIH